jgi:hypothetical protein
MRSWRIVMASLIGAGTRCIHSWITGGDGSLIMDRLCFARRTLPLAGAIRFRRRRKASSRLIGWWCIPVTAAALALPMSAFAQPVFVRTGNLNQGRYAHAALPLSDGRVLVVGGWGVFEGGYFAALSSAELYDPGSGTFSTTGSMSQSRIGPVAVRLADGKVLVLGGYGPVAGGPYLSLASAEIYDAPSGNFSLTGSMSHARQGMTATLLANGTVLVTGGVDDSNSTVQSAELYDPVTGVFMPTGNMNEARQGQTATLLNDGDVLIAGGCGSVGCPLATAELYHPATGGFTPTGSMSTGRSGATATLLRDGRVLIAGGGVQSGEIYDPTTGTFSPAGAMTDFRRENTATLLTSGHVLFAGGDGPLDSAELFDPTSSSFTATTSMHDARAAQTATLLGDGSVLVIGGANFFPLTTAELYYESGYVDRAPPTITVPADITVVAPDSSGASVFYTVSAVDNLDNNPSLTCNPQSGSLFAIGTSTVACAASDSAGNTSTASFRIIVLPPLNISMSINSSGNVNTRTGVASLRGSVTCNRATHVFINGELKQTVAQRALLDNFFSTELDCSPASASWVATIAPTSGRYIAGKAAATASAYSCDQFGSCASSQSVRTITLRGS